MSIDKPKELTQGELLELITDIAYQQSSRELSGSFWFSEFLEKINKYQFPKRKEIKNE